MRVTQFNQAADIEEFLSNNALDTKAFNALSDEKKSEFGLRILKEMDARGFSQEGWKRPLSFLEKLIPHEPLLLFEKATLFYRHGLQLGQEDLLLQAQSTLEKIVSNYPHFLQEKPQIEHLLANILVALWRMEQLEIEALAEALEKFEKVSDVINESSLYWDWAVSALYFAKESQELSDYRKGIDLFTKALALGADQPHFFIDCANAWMSFGIYLGNPAYINEAKKYIEKAFAHSKEEDPQIGVAWRLHGLTAKHLFSLTHTEEHFQYASTCLQEAILAAPQCADLWLEWGELYLQAGWIKKDTMLAQKALEILTSLKADDCNPLRLSALLSEGLVVLGFLLDDYQLLKDGHQRILDTLELAPDYTLLYHSLGIAELCLGLYFSDQEAWFRAVESFKKKISHTAGCRESLYGLFRTYLQLGEFLEDLFWIKNAVELIAHVSSLSPNSFFYLNEWGEALLKQSQFENKEKAEELIESAILLFQRAYLLYNSHEVLYNLGCAYDLLGNLTLDAEAHQQAISLLIQVYQLDPTFRHVTYQLALALTHEGELTGTIENVFQAQTLFETLIQNGESDGEIWTDFGYVLLMLSTWVDAVIYPNQVSSLRIEAEKKLMQGIEGGVFDAYYHLACLYSLAELNDASIKCLEMAEDRDVLPSLEILQEDEWLSNVRKTQDFQKFLY